MTLFWILVLVAIFAWLVCYSALVASSRADEIERDYWREYAERTPITEAKEEIMSDYIKREDAIFIALQQPLYSVVSQIKQLEGIDIVRCKECKYRNGEKCQMRNNIARRFPNADDFCSYGERSE